MQILKPDIWVALNSNFLYIPSSEFSLWFCPFITKHSTLKQIFQLSIYGTGQTNLQTQNVASQIFSYKINTYQFSLLIHKLSKRFPLDSKI
jgi:hypothetical protein